MLNPKATWVDKFKALKLTQDAIGWIDPFVNWVDEQVTGKLEIPKTQTTVSSFVFNKSVFKTQILLIMKEQSYVQPIPAVKFAQCWKLAILSSTMTVPPDAPCIAAFASANATASASQSPPAVWLGIFPSMVGTFVSCTEQPPYRGGWISVSAVVNPALLAKAEALIIQRLSGAKIVDKIEDADYPSMMREAFLGLGYIVTGTTPSAYNLVIPQMVNSTVE